MALLEYKGNPDQLRKERESLRLRNKSNDRASLAGSSTSPGALNKLVNNGYVSNTLKTLQIGIKSRYEWIGEDLLAAVDPTTFKFDYSAIAKSKLTTYEINFSDFLKIVPPNERDRMKEIVEFRRKRNAESAINHFMNLK